MLILPTNLLEGSNAAIAIALLIMVVLQARYISATAAMILRSARSEGRRRVFCSAYLQLKPVIALTVAAAGLWMRSTPIWWQRFAWHHGLAQMSDFWFHVALHVVGTMGAIIGLLCWVRVTIPSYMGNRAWLVAVCLTCAAFASPWLADGAIGAWAWVLDAIPRFKVF